nr:MAG TPA: hypothetical protein [Caudoviricetes sp.]
MTERTWSVRFSRLSERVRQSKRKPARYFMHCLGRAFSFCSV